MLLILGTPLPQKYLHNNSIKNIYMLQTNYRSKLIVSSSNICLSILTYSRQIFVSWHFICQAGLTCNGIFYHFALWMPALVLSIVSLMLRRCFYLYPYAPLLVNTDLKIYNKVLYHLKSVGFFFKCRYVLSRYVIFNLCDKSSSQ